MSGIGPGDVRGWPEWQEDINRVRGLRARSLYQQEGETLIVFNSLTTSMARVAQIIHHPPWPGPSIFKSSSCQKGKEAAVRQGLTRTESLHFYVEVFKKKTSRRIPYLFSQASVARSYIYFRIN